MPEIPEEMVARAIALAELGVADDTLEERWYPDCKPIVVQPADIHQHMTLWLAEEIVQQVLSESEEPWDSPLGDALECYLMGYGATV